MKKLIPASVLAQMFSLTVEQIDSTIHSGGGDYEIDDVTCLGMMPGGVFVYSLTGKNLPDHIRTFKVKLDVNPKFLSQFKEETQAKYAPRVIQNDYVLCWGG